MIIKRFVFFVTFLLNFLTSFAQMADLTYQGQTYVNSETGVWTGVDVPRTSPTNFKFLYNSLTSVNTQGYMLQAGDEGVNAYNGNLNGEIIQGNQFIWNGNYAGLGNAMTITHGVFTGCNINVQIKHNYLYRVPMGIIRKSASNMVNTSGGVSYNILKTFNVGGVVKGMSGVKWYNNTFYQDRPTYSNTDPTVGTWRGAIDVYTNTDITPNSISHGTKIKNNIFYSKYKTLAINVMDVESLIDFECDYNVYWVEEGDHTPVFNAGGSTKTWDQWRAMGYDQHSVVINPNFIDFVNFVPASRLNYGTDLGAEFNTGLATNATWTVGSMPATAVQNGTWQVGARIYASTAPYAGPEWYVTTSGSDATGNGSSTSPWRTLSYAITKVTTVGHRINLGAGSFSESSQLLLANGVSVRGAGRDLTTLILTYSSSYPCMKLETSNGWGNVNYGNQNISGIKFVGNLVGKAAIGVNFRSNVAIYDCTFDGFVEEAVFFNGQPTYTWTLTNPYNQNPNSDYTKMPDPNGWCTGNKFYNNIVTNCSGALSYSASGAICLGTQDGFVMYGNTINSSTRNGYGIKFWDLGFNKNSDIHDNEVTVASKSSINPFEFAIEWWWGFGGDKFYNNRLRGALDMVHMVDNYSYGYSAKIYGNQIARDATPSTLERGILLEGRCEYVQIYRNKIHHVAIAFYIPRNNYTGVDRLFHIDIYDNLCYKLGQTTTNWQTWGIYYPDFSDEAEHQYVKIQNNVFEADNSLSTNSMFGVQLPNVTKQSYTYVDNNIIINFDNSPILANNARTKAAYVFVRNNLFFNNGNNNLPLYDAAFRNSLTNYTESGTVISNPAFVSSTDYHLSSSSPAIAKGINVGLSSDFDGVAWKTVPSIGAYEYTGVNNGPYYLAPNGSDTNGDGTINNPWFSLTKAWTVVKPGDYVYMRGGTYIYDQQILKGKSGTAGNLIKVFAYSGEKPKITPIASYNPPWWPYALIEIDDGDYLHFKGLEITGVKNTKPGDGTGFYMSSNHSIVELFDYHDNGSGMDFRETNDVLLLNSDIYRNADPNTTYDPYGNADGIAFNGTNPNAVNYVRGCRMWWNTDDGIDLWQYQGHIYVENCWAFWNGFIPGTWNKGGDGNGFKMGIQDVGEYTVVKQHYYNNLSFQNKKWGFLDNGAKVNIEVYNNTAYQNGYKGVDSWSGGFNMTTTDGATKYYVKNNIAYANANEQADMGDLTNINHNTWDLSVMVTDADFLSVDVSGVTSPRKSDGSLPDLNFLKLAQGSDLIDKGINVGLPYKGTAPDLGAYESNYSATLPNLNTTNMTDVTKNSAVTGGNVTSDGGSPITAKGVCWNTSPNPTTANSRTNEGPGGGSFISTLTGLTPNTMYYVRAYATNAVGTSYGEELPFTTLKELFLATITTNAVSDITENSAVCGGNVTSDGNTNVTSRGVCWNTSGNPTTANNIVYSGTGMGSFSCTLASLSPNTTYYARAFAINSVGIAYGEEVIFTTLKQLQLPVVTTSAITNVTQTSAQGGGNVTFDGFDFISSKGVVWDTSPNPTIEDNKTNDGTGTGEFSSSISDLKAGTYYYARAYAENSVGISYGEEESFKTLDEVTDELRIYPNPVPSTQNQFTVEVLVSNFDSTKVQIYDLIGRLRYEKKMTCMGFHKCEVKINKNAAKLTPGLYIVKVIDKKGKMLIGKVMIL